MIELVITIVIIGVVSAIAIPRMATASENARYASVKASLKALDTATEFYAAEHEGLLPCHAPDGEVDDDVAAFARRLLKPTYTDGTSASDAPFGPYLRRMPLNPFNGLDTVRIDGEAAGKSSAGWRFDSARRRFQADDPEGKALHYMVGGGGKPSGSIEGVLEPDLNAALIDGASVDDGK